ncbi:MAG TPA: hypothetical protein VMD78_16415 [Candidatus Baltobacteraceae bacterium]|nr:hypothetical protein [Candidatus Baltobacteraceae bacterium]
MLPRIAAWVALALLGMAVCAQSAKADGAVREQNSAQALQNASDCDRKCLYGFVDQYLHALVAKDPSRVPWAKSVTFTENNVVLALGDGLWGTITALGPEDVRAADPAAGQVMYMGVVSEHGQESYLALRLKVEGGKISEVETIVCRKGLGPGPFGDPEAMKPLPILLADVPPDQRTLRDKMIALADGYFNTLQLNDGHIFTTFDPACSRRENGVWTASDPHPDPNSNYSQFGKYSCEEGFKLGNYRWDDRLRARRFPLVDEEKGLILAGGFIDHSGRLQKYTTTDGVVHDSPVKAPHSFCFLELFKIQDGKIRHAEAVFITVPYNMPSPWVEGDH